MNYLPRALNGLGSYNQFIICRLSERAGKVIKLPLDHRNLQSGNPMDSNTWMSFEYASKLQQALGPDYKIGFVFTKQDPFFFFDIDNCFNDQDVPNEVASWALRAFNGAAVERSQSGKGLHLFGVGQCPEHTCKNIPMGIELYTENRFVMLTGDDTEGDCNHDCSAALGVLVNAYFTGDTSEDTGEWNEEPCAGWKGPEDDDVLINKALQSRSAQAAFGAKASFRDLWEANIEVLSVAYPDSEREFDASSADAALAQHLAFWTGNDHARILRLMERSALKREKWEARGDYYLQRTIRRATARQSQFYNSDGGQQEPKYVEPEEPALSDLGNADSVKPQLVSGVQYLSVEQQVTYFDGLFYVRQDNRIYDSKRGIFFDPQTFKATYGGYQFSMDALGNKTTDDAWKVFTQSQAARFPKVDGHLFRPEMPPGQLVEEEGLTYVNTYIPAHTPIVDGDAGPFLNLLKALVPDETDRTILLSYMAGILQYPGKKFQYCVVVQGTEGNGKSTLSRIIEYGVGKRYTHSPNSSELAKSGGRFNSWIDRKLFIIVEEIHVENKPGGLLDSLKPLITNDRIEIQGKGTNQFTGDNRANWMLQCNRKTDVPVTVDSRRYSVFFTAQQSRLDCIAHGLTDRYWQELYRWLREQNGFAICNGFLRNYQIPAEYNPALLSRAPVTSSTVEANMLGVDDTKSLIMDSIESDALGFRGGWVSSVKLQELLDRGKRHVPSNQLRHLMLELGYDWHPTLRNGKTGSALMEEDNKRTTLYIPRGHANGNFSDPKAVTDAYRKAQGYVVDTYKPEVVPTHAR